MNNQQASPQRSESTIREYQRVVKRTQDQILSNARLPGENITNPRTRALERAAWRWLLDDLLRDALRPQEVHSICRELLQKMKRASDTAVKQYREKVKLGISVERTTRRQTKRASLKGLDLDWRQQMLQLASIKFPQELDALRTLAITGLRPIELEKAVAVGDLGIEVCFSISGAKMGVWDHGQNGGQVSRQLTFTKNHPSFVAQIESNSVVQVSRRRLEYVVRSLSLQLWPKRVGCRAISPYTFRHAFAAELKAQGFTETEIALALGHQSTSSQTHYGSRAQGAARGQGRYLVEVWAASEVREPNARTQRKIPPKRSITKTRGPSISSFEKAPIASSVADGPAP
jgi:hypothetical protein